MSGIRQASAVRAPPESNADIDPTAANAFEHAFAYARWSPPASVWVSSESSSSLRPHRVECALKYVTKARTACCAELKMPGTGPVMSEALAMVIVSSEMPVCFANVVQFGAPGSNPGPRCPVVGPSLCCATGTSPPGRSRVGACVELGADTTGPWAAADPVVDDSCPRTAALAGTASSGLSADPPQPATTRASTSVPEPHIRR